MNLHVTRPSFLVAMALFAATSLVISRPASAQPPKPAVDDPFAPAKPGAAPGKPKNGDSTNGATEPAVILVIRESNPTTPLELTKAAEAVLNFGYPDEAKRYLAKLVEAKADDAAMAAVVREVGSDVVLRLQSADSVQPEGAQAARLILDGAQRYSTDSVRLGEKARDLSSDSPAAQTAALVDLSYAGPAVVPPLLDILKNEVRKKEHPQVIAALARFKGDSEGPLVAALETKDSALKALVIVALGHMRSRLAVPLLVRPALDPKLPAPVRQAAQESLQRILGGIPSRSDSLDFLRRRVKELLTGVWITKPDYEGNVTVWQWDAKNGVPISLKRLPDDAAVSLAAKLADDLAGLADDSDATDRLRWRTRLEAAQRDVGLANPLPAEIVDMAKQAGLQRINEVLDQCLDERQVAGAIAAARLLGQLGDDRLLTPTRTEGAPLVRALRYSDRRVRFAAIEAIGKIDPTERYLGAGWLVEGLSNSIATRGAQRILIAAVRVDEGQSLVGLMNELGYEADVFRVGWRTFEAAAANADYEAVLITDTIDHPAAGELAQWLRRDYRTAAIPIGIMARGDRLDVTGYRWENEPRMRVFPLLYNSETAAYHVQKLLATAGRYQTTADERLAHAEVALEMVGRLLGNPRKYPFYDVRRLEPVCIDALATPRLSRTAASALATFGSHPVQQALVDFASRSDRPLYDRQAATDAFANAVKNYGLNLTQGEIIEQFIRRERGIDQPEESQKILSDLVETIKPRLGQPVQQISTRYVEVLSP